MTTKTTSFEAAWKGFCARLDQISAENKELRKANMKLSHEGAELRLERRWQAQRIAQMLHACARVQHLARLEEAIAVPPASGGFREIAQALDAILKGDPPPAAL